MINIVNFFSSYQSLDFSTTIILYFTVLGIIVTLIALATSITQEKKQSLAIKHLRQDPLVIAYISYLLLSFILAYTFYLYNLNDFYVWFVFFLFISSFFFVYNFLVSLRREIMYSKLQLKFLRELKDGNK